MTACADCGAPLVTRLNPKTGELFNPQTWCRECFTIRVEDAQFEEFWQFITFPRPDVKPRV